MRVNKKTGSYEKPECVLIVERLYSPDVYLKINVRKRTACEIEELAISLTKRYPNMWVEYQYADGDRIIA